MDNASNNDTAMTELEVILAEKNIKFNAQQQRIWCYPHIINICVSHIVKSLGKVNDEGVEDNTDDTDNEDEGGYISDTDVEDEDEDEGETDTAIISKYVEEDKLLNWFRPSNKTLSTLHANSFALCGPQLRSAKDSRWPLQLEIKQRPSKIKRATLSE